MSNLSFCQKPLAWVACGSAALLSLGLTTPSFAQSTSPSQFSSPLTPLELAAFADVANSHWANQFIDALLDQDILEGFPGGDFRPNDSLTWGQFAAMMSQAFEDRAPTRDLTGFPSITRSHWSYSSLQSLYRLGFDFPTIDPDQTISRLEMWNLLIEGFQLRPYSGSITEVVSAYQDASTVQSEYASTIATATQYGFVVNYPSVQTLNLSQVVTRAEMAVMLYQVLVNFNQVTAINSPYVVDMTRITTINQNTDVNIDATETTNTTDSPRQRQNCNQGIGNGSEGCDPGNSSPHGGSNDEGGRTPGRRQ